jgi:hypothetical protein
MTKNNKIQNKRNLSWWAKRGIIVFLDFGHFHKRIWNEIEQYFMVCDFQR